VLKCFQGCQTWDLLPGSLGGGKCSLKEKRKRGRRNKHGWVKKANENKAASTLGSNASQNGHQGGYPGGVHVTSPAGGRNGNSGGGVGGNSRNTGSTIIQPKKGGGDPKGGERGQPGCISLERKAVAYTGEQTQHYKMRKKGRERRGRSGERPGGGVGSKLKVAKRKEKAHNPSQLNSDAGPRHEAWGDG